MIDFFITYQGQLVLNWAILSVASLGFRWTYLAGQFSMAHAALMGVGAYASAKVAVDLGWDVLPSMLLGAAAAMAASLVVSLLSLRLEELFLSIGTLAVGLGIISSIDHTEALGGPSGMTPPMIVGPWMILGTLAVILIASLWLDGARFGLSSRAVADDRIVAASSGLNVRLIRVLAWVLGGTIVGLGGSLFSLSMGSIAPHDFSFGYLTLVLIAVLAGGAGTAVGPLVGAAFIILLPEVVRVFSLDRGLIYGPLLILLVLMRPNGILPKWPRTMAKLGEQLRKHPGVGAQPRTALVPERTTPEPALVTDPSPVLSVKNVSIAFGGVRALDDVSFDVMQGSVHALIGPNGAGKTTLVNIITGALQPNDGQVLFRGRDVTVLSAHSRSRLGLSRTFQAPRLLPTLNLRQNVSIGQWYRKEGESFRPHIDVEDLLVLLSLKDLAERKVDSLNLAEQRRVEIARALATNPELLLLDEPTAGMNHVEALELIDLIVECCRRWKITVLLIEHNMNIVMTYSDDIVVVSFGKWIAEGTPEEIRQHPEVVKAYLGSSA